MLFVNTDIVFQEIPDQVTLAINISNCPCRCPGCHSKYLWKDEGEELNEQSLKELVDKCDGDITCVSFMGGDASPWEVNNLARYLREQYPTLNTAWYSGRTVISIDVDVRNFDYIKVGPYLRHLGPLNNPKTNQRMYHVNRHTGEMTDCTSWFWK